MKSEFKRDSWAVVCIKSEGKHARCAQFPFTRKALAVANLRELRLAFPRQRLVLVRIKKKVAP